MSQHAPQKDKDNTSIIYISHQHLPFLQYTEYLTYYSRYNFINWFCRSGLYLRNNRLHCNCDMIWFLYMYEVMQQVWGWTVEADCYSPAQYSGTYFFSTAVSSLSFVHTYLCQVCMFSTPVSALCYVDRCLRPLFCLNI